MQANAPSPVDRDRITRILESRLTYLMAVAGRLKGDQHRRHLGASDVVMEAMKRALVKIDRGEFDCAGRSDQEVNAWLVSVLKYTWKDLRRALETKKRTEVALPAPPAVSPSGEAVLNERVRLLEQAMAALEPWDRRLLALRNEEGLTFREIGERLGVSEAWAGRKYQQVSERLARAAGLDASR